MATLSRQVLDISQDGRRDFASILFTRTHGFAFANRNGRLVTEQVRLGDTGLRIGRVQSTGHWIRLTEETDASFLFPAAGHLALQVARPVQRVAAGEAVMVRPAARRTQVVAPDAGPFDGHVLMLPMAQLADIARDAGSGAVIAHDVVRMTGPQAQRLRSYVGFLLADLAGPPDGPLPSDRTLAGIGAVVADLMRDWLEAAAGAMAPVSTLDQARARRADEILRARADDPLSMAALAAELGVSLRSLQVSFQLVYGEGPRARLTRIRLENARARLQAGGGGRQVTDVAMDCGFTHLGRFAEVYLRTFGERPSETLARHRARARQH